jgi:hypothetical protein
VAKAIAKPEKPFTMRGGFVCPSCHVVLPAIYPVFEAYFRSQDITCPRCEGTLPPLWDLAMETVREDWTFMRVYQLAGANQTHFSAWLKADTVVQLNFNRWGIPKKAEILKEYYSPIGPADGHFIVPLRFDRSNNVPRHLRLIYGATYGRKTEPRCKLMVGVSWIVPGQDEVSTHHLVDAVKHYAGGRYDALTVPANVAVEAALTPVIRDWVTTFSEQWKTIARQPVQTSVLSLIAADTLRVPRLNTAIRGILDDLRDRRNSMGHAGKAGAHQRPLTATTAGELLTAAIFGFHYARFLRAAVSRLRRRRQLPPRTA